MWQSQIGTLFTDEGLEEWSVLSKVTQPGDGKGRSRAFLNHWPISWAAWDLNVAQPLAADVTRDSYLGSWAFDLVIIGQSSQTSLASIYTYRMETVVHRGWRAS